VAEIIALCDSIVITDAPNLTVDGSVIAGLGAAEGKLGPTTRAGGALSVAKAGSLPSVG
jgi:hypothetical protein